jgi:hypothetical protein
MTPQVFPLLLPGKVEADPWKELHSLAAMYQSVVVSRQSLKNVKSSYIHHGSRLCKSKK